MIRFFDFLFSFLGILILSPILLVISVAIKLTSNGPLIYKQNRVGFANDNFKILKFRTMLVESDKTGLLTIGGRDPRVTSVGYYLRKFKLDELPQLFNVLAGEMSLVGPRPEVRKYVDLYTSDQQKVLTIKPGITDWASIMYRNENGILENSQDPEQDYINIIMQDKIRFNLIYIENYGVFEYFKIIFATLVQLVFPTFFKAK